MKRAVPNIQNYFRASSLRAIVKLTWLALGEDQAARSRRVEQLIAL